MANSKILTAEQEMKLRQPIDDYVGKIQTKIDSLRVDGTDKVVSIQNKIDGIKRDRTLSKDEKDARINKLRKDLDTAKAVEAQNKDQISKLIADAEGYLKAHFDKEYYEPVKESCVQEKAAAKAKYAKSSLNWKRSIRRLSPRSPIIRRSRMRSTFIRTAGLMPSWIWIRIIRR